jgi:small basic protein
MHKKKEVGRDCPFCEVNQAVGVLFEAVEQADLPDVVQNYLLAQVAQLFDAVEVFGRLNMKEAQHG